MLKFIVALCWFSQGVLFFSGYRLLKEKMWKGEWSDFVFWAVVIVVCTLLNGRNLHKLYQLEKTTK